MLLVRVLPPDATVQGGGTYLYEGAGRVLHLHQPVSFLLELVDLLLVQQQVVVLELLVQSRRSLARTCTPTHSRRWHYLVLPAGVGRVEHVVAPVLSPDLVLLLRQEQQLLVTRLHVVVEAAQVVLTPLGVFLQEKPV